MARSILFVCMGNICRSPTAEGVFRKIINGASRVAEPLIILAKEDSVTNRRQAFDRLRDRDAVTKMFNELGPCYEESLLTK